mmetsp:Transcript_50985/g.65299  ORF Transcript_50985/g.65299 Transcript_50985/m.65299 type:complete len:210 (-) Transcript_50985:26-655(-)
MLTPKVHNFVSYFGSLVVYVIFKEPGAPINFATIMWIGHFFRRSLETLFLFNFSQNIVPIADSIQEFLYYFSFSWWICISVDSHSHGIGLQQLFGMFLWLICEYGNYSCHKTLALNSKKTGPKKRINTGSYLFNKSSCPHYFFEISSWFAFNLVTNFSLAGTVFMSIGATIMTCWAIQKHERYATPAPQKTPLFPFVDIRPPRFLVEAM